LSARSGRRVASRHSASSSCSS